MKLYILLSLLFAFFLFIHPADVFAADWYVDNQSVGNNSGTTWQNAWKSFADIRWGSGGVSAGDTLYISGGSGSKTYSETLLIGTNGTSSNPVTIDVGANSPSPAGHSGIVIISPGSGYAIAIGSSSVSRSYITVNGYSDGTYKLQTRNTTGAAVYIRSSKFINIDHIKITNTKDRGILIDGYGTRASNITIKGCDIRTGVITSGTQTDLIYGQLADDVTIDGNILIHGDTGTYHSDNIQMANNWKRLTIRNNWIEKMAGTGAMTDQQIIIQHEQAAGSFEWAKIYNNVVIGGEHKRWGTIIASQNAYGGQYYFWNNTIVGKYNDATLAGVVVQITGNLGEFKNNIVTGYDSIPVEGNNGTFTSANVTNNCFYNTTSRALTSPAVANTGGLNDINCNINTLTYQLNSGSPCINKGTGLSSYFTTDRDGKTRPVGAAWDIGAYEYGGTAPTGGIIPTNSVNPTGITPTSTGGINISINLLLHGIGKGGDNVNPGTTGTTNPLHPQRQVTVEFLNAANQVAASKQATIIYSASAGNFQGSANLSGIAAGVYTVRMKSSQYLRTLVPGIVQISTGQNISLSRTALVTGDINSDNVLSILDYNTLLDCYADLNPARNCADVTKKQMADLTDDGAVNQFDYNLFLREMSVQSGQ